MPLQEEYRDEAISLRNDLLKALQDLDFDVRAHDRDLDKFDAYSKEIEKKEVARDRLRETVNHLSGKRLQIAEYLKRKQEIGLEKFNLAIANAAEIVVDSDLRNMSLVLEENTAYIGREDKQDVNKREGGAVRSVLSVLIRYIVMKSDPDAIPVLFFDEQFGALSDNSSIEMQTYLKELSQDALIIGIEQRDILYGNIPGVITYVIEKGPDGYSTIKRDDSYTHAEEVNEERSNAGEGTQ